MSIFATIRLLNNLLDQGVITASEAVEYVEGIHALDNSYKEYIISYLDI